MKKTIPFTNFTIFPVFLSLVLLVTGLVFTIRSGFNLGVDFEAGLNLQVDISPQVSISDLRNALAEFSGIQIQVIGNNERFSIRVSDDGSIDDFSNVTRNSVISTIESAFEDRSVEILGEDYVEPRFAADLTFNTTILVIAAMLCILVYLWIRFRFVYALSSLTALIHDIAFMVLFIGTFQIELSASTIAAVLTIIGYSLNDTIVIFDRIRENEKFISGASFNVIVNTSITQSLSRTIITSLTTLLAVTAIFIFTTGAIQSFALNMIVGIVVGTYSSIFVASPALLALQKANTKKSSTEHTKQSSKSQSSNDSETSKEADNSGSDSPIAQEDINSAVVMREVREQRARKKKNRSK